jgi:putative ABC transport system permease protein
LSVRHLSLPLAVRPARRDRLRFLLTLFGVAVGVATITAIALANGSVLASFSASVDAVAGKASYTVSSDAGSVPEETLKRLAWLRAIGGAAVPAILDTALTKDTGDVVEVLGIDPLSEALVRGTSSRSRRGADLHAHKLSGRHARRHEPFARAHD